MAALCPVSAAKGENCAARFMRDIRGCFGDTFIELNEDQKEQLDEQLQKLRGELSRNPEAEFTYFQPDQRKSGGTYVTVRGTVKKIDEYRRGILLMDGTMIPMEMLFSILQAGESS